MFVIITLVLLLAVAIAVTTQPPPPRRPSAGDILDRRLAAGEVSPTEYRQRRDSLDAAGPPRRSRSLVVGGVVAAAIVIAAVAAVVGTQGSMMQMPMSQMPMSQMMEGRTMMTGMFGFGWIWMIVILALVVGVIAWAISRLSPSDRSVGGSDARGILDDRFARGEIDAEEYQQRRDALGR